MCFRLQTIQMRISCFKSFAFSLRFPFFVSPISGWCSNLDWYTHYNAWEIEGSLWSTETRTISELVISSVGCDFVICCFLPVSFCGKFFFYYKAKDLLNNNNFTLKNYALYKVKFILVQVAGWSTSPSGLS